MRYKFTVIAHDGQHEAIVDLPDDAEAERVARGLEIQYLQHPAAREVLPSVEVVKMVWRSYEPFKFGKANATG